VPITSSLAAAAREAEQGGQACGQDRLQERACVLEGGWATGRGQIYHGRASLRGMDGGSRGYKRENPLISQETTRKNVIRLALLSLVIKGYHFPKQSFHGDRRDGEAWLFVMPGRKRASPKFRVTWRLAAKAGKRR
jgi:hypothetical protein